MCGQYPNRAQAGQAIGAISVGSPAVSDVMECRGPMEGLRKRATDGAPGAGLGTQRPSVKLDCSGTYPNRPNNLRADRCLIAVWGVRKDVAQ